jgi:hypothetical protein
VAEHSDSFSKISPGSEHATPEGSAKESKRVHNDAQAARAEAEREREHTVGGDPEAVATPAASRVDAATARVRMEERPSPFGTSHFPPLPVPPGLDSKR